MSNTGNTSAAVPPTPSADTSESCGPTKPYTPDHAHARLARLVGSWEGLAKTYLDPSKPPVEARWEGRIESVLGGRFVRFGYRSELQGSPLAGELLVAFESGEKLWRTSWVDSFHTGTAILVSTGEGGAGAVPISLTGSYFAAPGHPHWGWRTELDDREPERLHLRMYNVSPEGQEDLGVDLVLRRV
jgi:Protein of unknown function (DUF1579)